MALEHFKFTPLPLPTRVYDPVYMRQLLRTMELYFTQLDSLTPNQAKSYRANSFFGGTFEGDTIDIVTADFTSLFAEDFLSYGIAANTANTNYLETDNILAKAGVFGPLMAGDLTASTLSGVGTGVLLPRGEFTSEVSQTAASTTAAYAVTFEANTYPYGVTLVSSSRMTCATAGLYSVIYSIQFYNSTAGAKTIYVWLRKNGTDIALSTRRYSIGDDYLVVAASFSAGVAATDYIEVVWSTSSTDVSIQPYAAGVAPTRPTTPAAIVSVVYACPEYPPPVYVRPVLSPAFALTSSVTVDTIRTL